MQSENPLQNRFQALLDASPMICVIFDEYVNIIDVNQTVLSVLKLKNKQEYIDNFFNLAPEYQPDGIPTKEKAMKAFADVAETGKGYINEWIQYASDGEAVPFEIHLRSMIFDKKNFAVAYARDLREHYRLKKLEKSVTKRLQAIIDASPMACIIFDEHINVLEVNQSAIDILGLSSKQEYIDGFFDLAPEFQSDGLPSKEKALKAFQETAKNGTGYIKDWSLYNANGELSPSEVYLKRIELDSGTVVIAYARDLREERNMLAKLEESMEQERIANQAKSRFLARMSHEIRTPISAVLGFSEIQLRNHAMPPQTEEVFAKIYDSANILLHIVNDILDFSKIESGKMTIIKNTYDVASLISDSSQLHLLYLDKKNILFQLNVDENMPSQLEGDVLRLRQIISNLLTNAFKYTESGTVTMSIHCENGDDENVMFVVKVRDTGMGMTPTQLEEIKSLDSDYVRLHEEEKPFVGGTGLGLPIVYNLLQMMDAHITFDSEPGMGTQVIVRIPQKVICKKALDKKLINSLQKFKARTWHTSKALEFKPMPLPYGKVLVIDDVDTNLYVAEAMLESFELEIELCESGLEAIEKVSNGAEYDIIFMDHMMPEMDGIEVTKILRDMGYKHPIVALTANAVKGQDDMFLNNGFNGFMSKPIDINRLNSHLVRFIKDKHEGIK